MKANSKSEYFFELDKKDFITSIDVFDDLILLSSFNKSIYLFQLIKESKLAEGKLINRYNFQTPILQSKFFTINNKIFILFCSLNNNIDQESNSLYTFELKREIPENIFFVLLLDFEKIITKINFFKNTNNIQYDKKNYNNNKHVNYMIGQSEDLQSFYFYSIKSQIENVCSDLFNDVNEIPIVNSVLSDMFNFDLLDKLNLQNLSYLHFVILENLNFFIVAGIEHNPNHMDDENKFDTDRNIDLIDNNVILIFRFVENKFEFLKEMKSPLNQITHSIVSLNGIGFIIGSLSGRIAVINNLNIENVFGEDNHQLKFSEFSFKAHKIEKEDYNYFFPVNSLGCSKS